MGSPHVCSGAALQCSFGGAPSTLNVLPLNRTMVGGVPAATLQDSLPIANVAPFGMCLSAANPVVISATAAALGVFTPMGCVPATAAPWIPGGAPTVLVGGVPALDALGTLICGWGGVIKVIQPGQMNTLVP
jgi:hypothetical protein